jgi:hypothetical protein
VERGILERLELAVARYVWPRLVQMAREEEPLGHAEKAE